MARFAAIGVASLVVTLVGSAHAADVPVIAPVVGPWSWTGFYIGGHVGGALESAALSDPFGMAAFGDRVRSPGFIAGGQAGANYQIGNVVIGAEADLSWATSSGDNTCFGIAGGKFYASNCSVHPDLFSTITGRLGYAFGRSLVYAKGGAAFEHNNVDFIVNSNPGAHVLTSTNSYGAWGWTAGGGVEYALTPAWSMTLEYDYLGFDARNVATPYVPGNPLPQHPVGPLAGLSNNVQEVKLGLNYKFGADPTLWPAAAPAIAWMPVKAPPLAPSGWEVEAGTRYMYSSGRAQWDLGGTFNRPSNMLVSRLTWDNMMTNSAELYGRVDTPWNVFLSGFIGAGETVSGGQNDEDFHLVAPPPVRPYNNTFSTNDGHVGYAVVDLGYDVLRRGDYNVGPFLGYTYFNQYISKFGCQQIANATGNCVVPLPSSQLIGLEDMRWQGLRVGLSGQVMLTDRLKLTADVAYLPYVTFNWLDDHLGRNLEFQQSGQGVGAQTQAVLSYDVTDRLNVGIGARYWAMWSNTADVHTITNTSVGPLRPNRNAIEMGGAFVQAGYRFAPGDSAAAKPAGFALPLIFKAPAVVAAYDWTGFYAGATSGGVWGESKQIGQLTTGGRHTADATPSFGVGGAVFGVTVGYNSQFDRIWVFGLEGDLSLATASGDARQILPFNVNQVASTREDWLSTARVRLGVTPADRWLVYATGGLAVADVEASVTPSNLFTSERHVRAGWTAGGGVEAAITDKVSAKLEYLHVGLEDHAYFVPTPNNPTQTNRAGGVPLNNEIVRVGINCKIDWGVPVAAKY
jgi:opacity protein-like surface antigen